MNSRICLLAIVILSAQTSCSKNDFLDGLDREALFTAPTQQELNAVINDWDSRNLSLDGYEVEEEIPIGTGGTLLKMISYTVDGLKEYGALVVPETEDKVPVRVWLNGFSFDPDNVQSSVALNSGPEFKIPYIFAVPAFRGQALTIVLNGEEYTSPISEGNKCEAFDRATDDAIVFLNLIEETEKNADLNKVSVRGGSRGGTVGLLMGQRDKRIKKIVATAGPTNMLELTSLNENDEIYRCQFLQDFVDGAITLEEARHRMIASSPIYFAELLPQTQLHLGDKDRIVPVSQGSELLKRITQLGLIDTFELFIYKDRNHGNIVNMNQELNNRIETFLSDF